MLIKDSIWLHLEITISRESKSRRFRFLQSNRHSDHKVGNCERFKAAELLCAISEIGLPIFAYKIAWERRFGPQRGHPLKLTRNRAQFSFRRIPILSTLLLWLSIMLKNSKISSLCESLKQRGGCYNLWAGHATQSVMLGSVKHGIEWEGQNSLRVVAPTFYEATDTELMELNS